MKLPIWMAGWEYECCGASVTVGDTVEWTLWSDLETPLLNAEGSAPRIKVLPNLGVEIVGRCRSGIESEPDGRCVIVDVGGIQMGIALRNDPWPPDMATFRGNLTTSWHHDLPLIPVVGKVLEIRWHKGHREQVQPRFYRVHWEREGLAISSTEAGTELEGAEEQGIRSPFLFSFIVDVDVDADIDVS
ncbi:MAG: hypothetical protein C7B43_09580 [Sulfobacillus benefaciens]|uniref:Uncharacterized protein n=1 Tax=Sulfobacillus benefaciens TaxID=453960 RepID=A0A2T2X2H4_9FIRM|nr:MAG: hypothetical protein C7B43_09580 [Sulfobacillus benefaciens]